MYIKVKTKEACAKKGILGVPDFLLRVYYI